MTKHVYLVFIFDIVNYPPILSIINVLLDLNVRVTYIGPYSDDVQKRELITRGVEFVDVTRYDIHAGALAKLIQQYKFRNEVFNYLDSRNLSNEDIVWIMNSETINFVYKLTYKYKTILHFFEFTGNHYNWKYRIASPFYNQRKIMHAAHRVVHCEYNRAMITKGLYGLEMPPMILPNKPYEFGLNIDNIPKDTNDLISLVREKTHGKNVVLYQGIFDSKERRLEEFCQAVEALPNNYVFLAMGKGEDYYKLKNKYNSERILFIPFVKPPYHLEITKLATIGILSYFPVAENYADVINPIYCAPNKIFEYAKFGIPMISNDVPGLHYIFREYKCGQCVPYPMSKDGISKAIVDICNNIETYSNGATEYYNSVDIESIIRKIIN